MDLYAFRMPLTREGVVIFSGRVLVVIEILPFVIHNGKGYYQIVRDCDQGTVPSQWNSSIRYVIVYLNKHLEHTLMLDKQEGGVKLKRRTDHPCRHANRSVFDIGLINPLYNLKSVH